MALDRKSRTPIWISTRAVFDWRDSSELESEGYWYEGPLALAHTNPNIDQASFRWRADDGTETTATWLQSADTNTNVDVSGGNVNIRLRFLLQETNGGSSSNYTDSIEYDHNSSASWTALTSSTSVIASNGSLAPSPPSDGDSCTQQLGSGTFIANQNGWDSNNSAGGANCDFAGNDETEFEFCMVVKQADVSNGDTIDIRLAGVNSRTVAYARITIVDPNRTVTGTTATVTATANNATVNRTRGVTGSTATVTATANSATVNRSRVVTGTTATVTVTANSATVTMVNNRVVNGTTATVTATANSAAINRSRVVVGSTATVTVAANSATVGRVRSVTGSTAVVTVTAARAYVVRDLLAWYAFDTQDGAFYPDVIAGAGTASDNNTATRYYADAAGVYQSFGSGVIGITYDPLNAAWFAVVQAAATNLATLSYDLSNAGWTKSNATATLNQTGMRGDSNGASLLDDSDSTHSGYAQESISGITDDSLWHVTRWFVKKDSDETRFPGFFLQLQGGTTAQNIQEQLNTKTGAHTTFQSAGNVAATVRDAGLWWELCLAVQNNSTGNTFATLRVQPAFTGTFGASSDVTVTGSIIVGNAEHYYDKLPGEIIASSPIFTNGSTGTISESGINITPYSEISNTVGAFYCEVLAYDHDLSQGGGQNRPAPIDIATSENNQQIQLDTTDKFVFKYYNTSNGNSTVSGANGAFTPGTVTKMGVAYGATAAKIDANVDGNWVNEQANFQNWGTDSTWSELRIRSHAISARAAGIPLLVRNLRFYAETSYANATARIDALMPSANRDVTGTTAVVTVTANAATVNRKRNVVGSTATVTVSANSATVTKVRPVTGTTAVVTVAANNAAINRTRGVTGTTAVVTVTANNATVSTSTDRVVTGTTAAVTVSANSAAINRTRNVSTATRAVTVSANAATVDSSRAVTGTTATVTATANAATINRERGVTGTTAVVTVAANAATVNSTRQVSGSTATVTATANPATVNRERGVTGTSATVTVTPNAATVTFTLARTVIGTSASILVSASPATIRFLRRVIPDQDPGWTEITPSQAAGFSTVSPSPGTIWTEITPTDSASWDDGAIP